MSVSVVACAFFVASTPYRIKNYVNMETKNINRITTAFINDRSPVMDLMHDNLVSSGVDIVFRSDNVVDGINQLSALRSLPNICIIDLDFSDKGIMKHLRELRSQYPKLKLIAHTDM